jgi:hypothetical protein
MKRKTIIHNLDFCLENGQKGTTTIIEEQTMVKEEIGEDWNNLKRGGEKFLMQY